MEIPDKAVSAAATNIAFTAIALVAVILRVYTRAVVVKNVGVDDYLMVASMVGSIAFLVVVFLQFKFGLGRQISLQELPKFLEAIWATIPLYNVALIFCKLSIAFQYYRLFRTPRVHRVLIAVICFLVVYGLWAILGTIFTCYPVQKYWNPSVPGTCLNRNTITYINAGVNVGSDLTLLAIPIPLLVKLQLPSKQKIILVGVFMCGALACTMSIIRLRSLYEIGHAAPYRQSVEGVNIAIWSCIEINVGILCASVPALKAFAVKIFPKILLSGIYTKPRFRYGHYVRQHSQTSQNGGGTDAGYPGHSRSDPASAKRTQITVEQSFEMNTVHNSRSRVLGPEHGHGHEPEHDQEQEQEAVSQRGSEKTLFPGGDSPTNCFADPEPEPSGRA